MMENYLDLITDRNNSLNYFLGMPRHNIAGREYIISSPRLVPDMTTEYGFKKVYVAEVLLRPKNRSRLVTLEVSGKKDGKERKWTGNPTDTEKRDLLCIIKA